MGQDADNEVTKTMTLEFRRRGQGKRFMLPTLRVVAGADMLRFSSVYPNETIAIGRDPTCDLVLIDASVSRRHATVSSSDDRLTLIDQGSTNGTTHNGLPVQAATELRVGDHLDIGAVTLRVDLMGLDELAHLNRVVERLTLANKDPLTGLVTRLFIQDDLPALMQRHQLGEVPLAIVFVDVDHFKLVNDRHGHPVGDEVLRAVGRLMALSVRDTDTCVRYGGEEFLAVLPNCDETGAVTMAERLRREVENHDWSHYGPELAVTISLGVARHKVGQSTRDFLDSADRALYAAKRAGRNRVIRASEI